MEGLLFKAAIKYENQEQQISPYLQILIHSPYFTRSLSIATIPLFSNIIDGQYQLQVHSNALLFFPLQINQRTKDELSILSRQTQAFFKSISVQTFKQTGLQQKNRLKKLFSITTEMNLILGFHLFEKCEGDHKQGDIIFYYEKNSKNKLAQFFQTLNNNYYDGLISYDISQMLKNYKIPKGSEKKILKQLVSEYEKFFQFKFLKQNATLVQQIQPCLKKDDDQQIDDEQLQESAIVQSISEQMDDQQQQYWSLSLKVFGNINQIYQVMKKIQTFVFKQIPLILIDMDKINCTTLDKIPAQIPQNSVMVHPKYFILFSQQIFQAKKFLLQLYSGYHMVTNQKYSQEQLRFLNVEYSQDRIQSFLRKNGILSRKMSITEDRLIIKCHYQVFSKILEFLDEYLKKNMTKKICAKVQILADIQSQNVFMKNSKKRIQKRIFCTFKTVNQQVWVQCYENYKKQILEAVSHQMEIFIKKFIVIPSLKPISPYSAELKQIQGLYTVEKNPSHFNEESLFSIVYSMEGKIKIIIESFYNVVNYQQNMVFFIHNDLPKDSYMQTFTKQNGISLNNFMEQAKGIRPKRVVNYPLKNNKFLSKLTLIHFNIKNISLYYINEDLQNLLIGLSHQKEIKIMIGKNSKKMVKEIVPIFLKKVHELEKKLKVQKIHLLYEDKQVIPSIEVILKHLPYNVVEEDRYGLNQWCLLKIYNLHYYNFLYYWHKNTCSLPSLDSYFIQYTINKRLEKYRMIICLLTPNLTDEFPEHYLIQLKKQKLYHFVNCAQVKEYSLYKVSKIIQRVVKLVRTYVNKQQYLVLYGKTQQKMIGEKICLNMYYLSYQKKQKLIPLSVDLKKMKIIISDDNKYLINYHIQKKKYIECFKVEVYNKNVKTLIECFEK